MKIVNAAARASLGQLALMIMPYAPAYGCEAELNAACVHICALHGHTLVARKDRSETDEIAVWRCY